MLFVASNELVVIFNFQAGGASIQTKDVESVALPSFVEPVVFLIFVFDHCLFPR